MSLIIAALVLQHIDLRI